MRYSNETKEKSNGVVYTPTEMERRGEQSISLSMSRIAEMTTSDIVNIG